MNARAYYNEIDPFCAQWLRNLIAAGHIAAGDVDERSIVDVRASDLAGYTQCHFFAGIGIWSAALRQARWADARSVWTGSCPCQPLSAVGKRLGAEDERHLWPVWFELIRQCRPVAIFGEQVASKDGLAWLDIVQSDLDNAGYASGAVDLCAAGVGAPHIRQRLFFMAYAAGEPGRLSEYAGWATDIKVVGQRETSKLAQPDERQRRPGRAAPECARGSQSEFAGSSVTGELGHAYECREGTDAETLLSRQLQSGSASVMGNTGSARSQERERDGRFQSEAMESPQGQAAERGSYPGATNGFWAGCDWIPCTDGKARPVEAGTFPLAYGDTGRVGKLRAYGNAVNKEATAEFITAAKAEIDSVPVA